MTADRVQAEPGLTEREQRILDFERRRPRMTGPREQAIREEFGVAPARYHQMLNAVLDSPAAERHDPLLVRRLRRVREARSAARSRRSFRLPSLDSADTP